MRKQSIPDPQTPEQLIIQRIEAIERKLGIMGRAGATTIPVIDVEMYNDPVQSEVAIDYITNTVWFYHEDEWRPIGELKAKHEIKVFLDEEILIVGDKMFAFGLDTEFEGLALLAASAYVTTVGSSATIVQIRNISTATDMLSTRITIDSGDLDSLDAGTQPVIDPALTVLAKQQIAIDVDTIGTGAKGLGVRLFWGIRRPTI